MNLRKKHYYHFVRPKKEDGIIVLIELKYMLSTNIAIRKKKKLEYVEYHQI